MEPTPYQELNQVLDELVARIQQLLHDDLVGAYLQGSFAVGDFDEHSDVDFIVVVENNLRPDQVAALQVMHDRIYTFDSQWAQHLGASYFPREILRDPAKQVTQPADPEDFQRTLKLVKHVMQASRADVSRGDDT